MRHHLLRLDTLLATLRWLRIASTLAAAGLVTALVLGDQGRGAEHTAPLLAAAGTPSVEASLAVSNATDPIGAATEPVSQVAVEDEPPPVVLQVPPPPIPVPDLPDIPNPLERLSPKRLAAELLEALLTTLGDSSLNFVTLTPAAGTYESPTVRSLWTSPVPWPTPAWRW